MGMKNCDEVFSNISVTSHALRQGKILGSTEAGFAVLKDIEEASKSCPEKFPRFLLEAVPSYLKARPTSVVMKNLLREYLEVFLRVASREGLKDAIAQTPQHVESIIENVENIKDAVATLGSKRINDGDIILTHSYSSTIIKLLQKALDRGLKFSVIITESRPIGEGKYAAEVISRLGVDTTLIVDSAVRFVMKRVNRVFVSADAVAANGAVINKAGTSAIALAAKEARVRTYVTAGTYRIGLETVFGELIEGVVLSDASLIMPEDKAKELSGRILVKAPLFDVTPPEYIDAIITEKGVLAPQAIPLIIKEIYGWPPRLRPPEELLEEVRKYVS